MSAVAWKKQLSSKGASPALKNRSPTQFLKNRRSQANKVFQTAQEKVKQATSFEMSYMLEGLDRRIESDVDSFRNHLETLEMQQQMDGLNSHLYHDKVMERNTKAWVQNERIN